MYACDTIDKTVLAGWPRQAMGCNLSSILSVSVIDGSAEADGEDKRVDADSTQRRRNVDLDRQVMADRLPEGRPKGVLDYGADAGSAPCPHCGSLHVHGH